ncbi:flavin reductase family protein [Stenotrophobium rhamnosiphilum]|uniref:Flavin reductase n=1 Tax=Stenotrophobium rhamnosiphilum TaxID=2029166 RepID=A0A2T5MGT9_9GAMM|nr:flavin reductase family protein [Stenotrophobium rhamnosiphilum]PTU31749.1 flavin reductase [Stenotrophobium rhamnosiphilum]
MKRQSPDTVSIEPAILYFGTPVVLISTTNEDGSMNIAPMSSAFWLGWRCMLGLDGSSKTTENLIRTGELVLNLPSPAQVDAVDRLAKLTGSNPIPGAKQMRGYSHEKNKFEIAGLTPVPSETIAPARASECPVQMEAVLSASHGLMDDDEQWRGGLKVFEVRIQRVHVHPSILMDGVENRIDPDKWNPLIMSFQKFYGLAPGQVHPSRLGEIPEQTYLSPDVARAKTVGNMTR